MFFSGGGLGVGGLVALIVGLVVAALAVPIIIGALLYWRKRQQRRLIPLIPPDYDALRFSNISTKNCLVVVPGNRGWDKLEQV